MNSNEKKAKKGVLKTLRSVFSRKRFVSAVILAGGSSLRYGGDTPKQFLPLLDKPVIVHSMLAFENAPSVKEIIIVCREADALRYDVMAEEYGISKYKKAVVGGDTRQVSSLAGLDATDTKADYVLIHDGARPMITPDAIEEIVMATKEHRAACAATASRDTVKIADDNGFITRTEDRTRVYLAQTPQGFYKPLLEACAYSAKKEAVVVTDDASLLEHYHYPIKLVDTGSENIKITTPSDLILAEAILAKRRESEENV
ncbi:MAG: 2-C-methyl-D-erythritol 4-phosphate cytidylyltransferase [Clostridia bacterium]|nr:2-C-methyl-D-erythritol 4-phosphate cytidylyltransferase [Clostridia bacterium]